MNFYLSWKWNRFLLSKKLRTSLKCSNYSLKTDLLFTSPNCMWLLKCQNGWYYGKQIFRYIRITNIWVKSKFVFDFLYASRSVSCWKTHPKIASDLQPNEKHKIHNSRHEINAFSINGASHLWTLGFGLKINYIVILY